MKKIFIFMSIFVICLIAFFDARERIQELDEVAANTPAQVEMMPAINKPEDKNNTIQNHIPEVKEENQDIQSKDFQNSLQKSLDNVDKRRDTLHNRTN